MIRCFAFARRRLAVLMQAIQAGVDVFVDAHADQVDDQGRRRIMRNGHVPERSTQTGIGPIEVQRPRGDVFIDIMEGLSGAGDENRTHDT